MEYSKIKTFRVKNFRNIGDITLDFTESPIITLVGENEAGKTSMIKAFGVTGLHAYPREQKDYIRDGTNGFGVAIELEDGTIITRIKNNASNMYVIEKPDGTRWDTNKIDAGLPVQVQEIMGLIEEPETKEYLHIRTYEDQLLFVVTPASTNYKVMYNALKVEQLTRAIKQGSTQANELKAILDNNITKSETLINEIKKIRLYDIEPAVNIKNRITKELQQVEKLEKAMNVLERINAIDKELGTLAQISQAGLQPIDLLEVSRLESISRNMKRVDSINKLLTIYSQAATLESIDMTMIEKLKNALIKTEVLQGLNNRLNIYDGVDGIEYIDTSILSRLKYAVQQMDRINELDAGLIKFNSDGAEHITERDMSILGKLQKAINMKSATEHLNSQLQSVEGAEPITEKDMSIISKIQKAIGMQYSTTKLEQQLKEIDSEKMRLSGLIKDSGAIVSDCPNCGESIVVDARAYV